MKTFSKTKSWLSSVTALVLIVFAVSCQSNDPFGREDITAKNARIEESVSAQNARLTSDYQVRGGTLHFKDNDAFMRVHTSLAKMSGNERLKFAQTAGFKSLLTYQDEFVKACEAAEVAKDETAYKVLLANYADVVSLDASLTLSFKVQSPLLASYADRTGVLYIGKALYKFGDLEQTIVLDGDRAKLKAPNSSIVKQISHRPNTNQGGRKAAICSFIDNKYAYGSCGDRRSKLAVVAQPNTTYQPNGQYTNSVTPYAVGFSYKKNAFGNWVHYNTNNRMFANWTFYAYTNEAGKQNGPDNPYVFFTQEGPFETQNDGHVEKYGPVASFPNSNAGSTGNISYYFDFEGIGWHDMVCVRNSMSCP